MIPMIIQDQFIPSRIFRDPLFHKPVTGQEPFFAVSYSKPALIRGVKVLFLVIECYSISKDVLALALYAGYHAMQTLLKA